jgi:hypothetical protein
MSTLRSQDETSAREFDSGCGGRGARYVEKLERYPERDLEPGVVRRARALVRTVLGLGARVDAAKRKAGGKSF